MCLVWPQFSEKTVYLHKYILVQSQAYFNYLLCNPILTFFIGICSIVKISTQIFLRNSIKKEKFWKY